MSTKRKNRLAAGGRRRKAANNGTGKVQKIPTPAARRTNEGKLLGKKLVEEEILAIKLSMKMEECLQLQKQLVETRLGLQDQVIKLQGQVKDLRTQLGIAELKLGMENARKFRADKKLNLKQQYHMDDATGEWFEVIPEPEPEESEVKLPNPVSVEDLEDRVVGSDADDDDDDEAEVEEVEEVEEDETAEAETSS